MDAGQVQFHTIVLPVRPQPDTITAIFILKQLGKDKLPGISQAKVEFWSVLPDGKSPEEFFNHGYILIDLGGGAFDHHNKIPKTTASDLTADFLEAIDDPTLAKLLEYARRDDFYGKGTISEDPIDRAFGLSALIAVLNKNFPEEPARVIETVLPFLAAHFEEEKRRFEKFPNEVAEKKRENRVWEFIVKQRDKKLNVIMIESGNVGLSGYLRSRLGGKYDVVAQKNEKGQISILTRSAKRIDLRSLAALIRLRESEKKDSPLELGARRLISPGRIDEVPEWYYDTATNSMLNGAANPNNIIPTRIEWPVEIQKIIQLGLSEELFDPRQIY